MTKTPIFKPVNMVSKQNYSSQPDKTIFGEKIEYPEDQQQMPTDPNQDNRPFPDNKYPEPTPMLGTYDDFIGTYRKCLSDDFCQEIMDAFDYHQQIKSVWCEDNQFPNSNAGRFDWAIELGHIENHMKSRFAARDMNQVLVQALEEYINVFGHLKTTRFYSTAQKVQKTPAGGGYHVWHDENTSATDSNRKIVWMFYLNDDFDGGETEFLYYKKRVKPERGTLILWPAGLTHCHKGNLVLKGTKYIVTGWYNIAHD